MTETLVPPQKILAVMDDSKMQTALLSAATLAEQHNAALHVLGCVEPPNDLSLIARLSEQKPDRLLDRLCAEKRDRMAAHLATHLPGHKIVPQVKMGKAFIEIIKHVIDTGCDFVVKQAEPLSGIHRLLFASTDQHLVRKCPCPVWMQPVGASCKTECVIAAVDVDLTDAAEPDTLMSLNQRVIQAACFVAAPKEARVLVIHAWDAVGEGLVWAFSSDTNSRVNADRYINEILDDRHRAMRHLLETAKLDLPTTSNPTLMPRLIRGTPEAVIEEQSRELAADVVVMGTIARTGLGGVFIGNTAENIINNLECPVLAVKPDGFISPLDKRFGTNGA